MNDLLKKLEEEGKRKASELLSSWEKKKKERMSELEKELDSYREGREKYYSLKGEREKNGLLSSSRMALKKKTLLEKRKIFEDLFVKMSAEFFRFHDERYYAFLDRYTGELP
ncbi:MAG TPA: hypothetical protein VJC03_01290, partial [bacterium]|nr:hypothetical protein [bacterium]